MIDKDILKNALTKSGMKQIDLANAFHVNKSTISTGMRRDKMTVDIFCKYLSAMGYTVYVGKMQDGAFEPMWELKNDAG